MFEASTASGIEVNGRPSRNAACTASSRGAPSNGCHSGRPRSGPTAAGETYLPPELIGTRFGPAYLPEKPISYKSKAGAQEAHEAIRPTDANLSSQQIEAESDALRLYDLIWRQFVACQMPPAEFDTTTVTIAAADCELAARGRVLRFDGFFKVQQPAYR